MTDDTFVPGANMSGRRFVLATDLDGTFLGGSDEDRKRLYDWIEENRSTIGLIFVTGRDPKFIVELCEGGVPWPEYVVGDVGTTIAQVHGKTISPIDSLETEIAETWNDGGEKIREALADAPGLTLQDTDFRYRVSYDLDPDAFDIATNDKVREMGYDPLASDNRFYDVLPRGISKGPSIKRLVSHLGIAPDTVLCAGDTLNDLSMLECGLPAVAVGGAEAALVDRVSTLPHVYVAKGIGAAGILEAVAELDLHDTPEG
ncbi:HAD-IIB family hydrolase [Palleronia sp. LCG004]|uniref:HAD-IIB family hydrolase n=1 Tax=Palleronia sp. LCG004 TaxID=3079304 RepID=UPI0029421E7B|nr:HAD-IIB family hydrolase [Palleronia sp. LCG004]WOI57365.1 HAD-IIB family hydrolase [Palleronia sp. LCG004]